jgi:predicted DNA-binding transcriptional regulator YafY
MRAGRLVALLLVLQQRGGSTAASLAEQFEVSVRTIYRDVSSLQAAGVPLWTETGPGGGIRLLEGWRTNLDGLTAEEAGSLFVAGTPTAAAELGLGAVLAAAQAKVLSTLPPDLAARATRVRERFLLDAPGWFHHDEAVAHLPAVATAVWESRRLVLRYGPEPPGAQRTVDPLGLVLKAGIWYLVAGHRGRPRTWRVGRMHHARVIAGAVQRPTGFDLASYWSTSSASFVRSMATTSVQLRVHHRGRRLLGHLVDAEAARRALADAGTVEDGGWVAITLDVESEEVAAEQLAGLGPHVEVVAPASLRDRLAAVGRAMATNNAPR